MIEFENINIDNMKKLYNQYKIDKNNEEVINNLKSEIGFKPNKIL